MLSKFIFDIRVLSDVMRFSTRKRLKNENVAEHSFYTAFYAMVLADLENQMGNRINVEKVLRIALIHDLEESVTGDIIHGFKVKKKELKNMIEQLGVKCLSELLEDLPKSLASMYQSARIEYENVGSVEGRIVFVADKLEALLWALEERNLGNKGVDDIIQNTSDLIKSQNLKSGILVLEKLGLCKPT